jgi:cytochrome c peroxidase
MNIKSKAPLSNSICFAILALILLLPGTVNADTEPDIKQHYKDSLVQFTENNLFSIEIKVEGKDLREGENIVELIIYDKSGNDVENAEVSVTAAMPETGEESAEVPVVTEMGGGFYSADNIILDNKGHWELKITIKKYALEDTAVFNFPEETPVAAEEQTVPADQPEEKVIKDREIIAPAVMHEKYRTVLRPLPALPPIPADNSITPDKVRLGKMLFWDRRVSKTGTTSCVFCHHPSYYGAEPMRKSVGINGNMHLRNAQTVLNAAFLNSLFWAGESPNLEHQALIAIKSPVAMGSIPGEAAERLNRIPEYKELSIKVFSEPLTEANMGKALAAYMRTVTTPDYPLARWLQGDENALTEGQKKGMVLFVDKGCIGCHSGPLFSSAAGDSDITASAEGHQDNGHHGGHLHKVLLPGAEDDPGLAKKTGKKEDRYFFKVPLLLNVAKTPPYTHAGLINSLHDMVIFMSENMVNIELSSEEADNIAAFLHTLTGKLPQNFLTAPALPTGSGEGDFGPEFMHSGTAVLKSNSAEVQKDPEEQENTEEQ